MAASNGHDLTFNSTDDNNQPTGMSFYSALHSTPQRDPAHYDQFHGYAEPSIHTSDQEQDHSSSIEMGRGVKRGARDDFADDLSSNAPLSFGNDDSMYQVLDTPPTRPRTSQRKSDGTLRKEASVRRATESTLKRSTNGAKPRAASENAQHQQKVASSQNTANFNVRASRFTGSRQTSAHATSVPTRFTAMGGLEFSNQTSTAISATYNTTTQTNQSFLLPDLPNINELVLGVRKDGTPVTKRTSRSRFTSASYNPQTISHIPVNGVAVPDDEKAIYASLQMLKGRLTQLEMENGEAQKRAEHYEAENINLRSQASQANVGTRRPDSGLGSDDDDDETLGPQKSKLQASVQALQDHVSRYERKISVSETAISRVTKERDSLITQIGQAYLKHEELVEENEAFRETQADLVAENEELRESQANLVAENEALKHEMNQLKHENLNIRGQLETMKSFRGDESGGLRRKSSTSKTKASRKTDREEVDDIAGGPWNFTENKTNGENSIRSRKEGRKTTHESQTSRHKTSEQSKDASAREMAARIEREIEKLRAEAGSQPRVSRAHREHSQRSTNVRSRSKSQRRRSTNDTEHITTRSTRRNFSAPADSDVSEAELTVSENDATATYQKQDNFRAAEQAQVEQDLTELSELNFKLAAELRKKLEDERVSKRRGQSQAAELDHTGRSTTHHSNRRKSSMKDMTAGAEENTGRLSTGGKSIEELLKISKTVRVQSPHSSDATFQPQQPEFTEIEDASMLSNTSRRRRRTGSTEGMTSAFIIPDITIHGGAQTVDFAKTCILHNTASCTVCLSTSTKVDIPTPVRVTERDLEDITNATIRPAQPPAEALATVIKNLEDEITHLKMQKEVQNQAYNQHDPALSKHRRLTVKAELFRLIDLIEKRTEQVYKLYDVLEGQKKQEETNTSQEIEESIEVGRTAPADKADEDDFSGLDTDELPWEGLSEVGSDD